MARVPGEPIERALRSLNRILRAAERGEFRDTSFVRARGLIGHFDSHIRWQALIAVGCWIPFDPDAVWQVVLHRGRSRDKDMRVGVGVVLLEHLLEHDFRRYFPLVQEAVSAEPLLADTLRFCWPFGGAKRHWWRVRPLLARSRRARPKPRATLARRGSARA